MLLPYCGRNPSSVGGLYRYNPLFPPGQTHHFVERDAKIDADKRDTNSSLIKTFISSYIYIYIYMYVYIINYNYI